MNRRAVQPAIAAAERHISPLENALMPRRRGLRPQLLAAVVRSNATLAFAAEGKSFDGRSLERLSRSFLFNWNPKRWHWENLDEDVAECLREGSLRSHWSSGNRKDIPVGSRIFLIRLGVAPKGIVGVGMSLSPPTYAKGHWDPARNERGVKSLGIEIDFHLLQNKPLVDLHVLDGRAPFDSVRWDNQSSGVEVPASVAVALDKLIGSRVPRVPRVGASLEELYEEPGLPEGALHQVMVNAYERSSAARDACIAHHGFECSACGLLMEDVYGERARHFVHVHHVVPLSTIKRRYRVNPRKDLRPLCPNCHAVVHLFEPALTVSEVKRIVTSNRLRRRIGR